MWTPKYIETKQKAERVASLYKGYLEAGMSSIQASEHVADVMSISLQSVYRYLRAVGVSVPKRKRDPGGRFTT